MTKQDNKHKALRDLITYIEKLEKNNYEDVKKKQFQQLHRIVSHAENHSPYFSEQLKQVELNINKVLPEDYFKRLPIFKRRDIQSAGDSLFCQYVPKQHMPLIKTQTSGSTGEPVKIIKTNINHLFWLAHTFREHRWWQRDISKRLAIIRAGIPEKENTDWTSPLNILYKSGPSFTLPINTDINKQIIWLRKHQPDYLLTYPSNILEIIRILQNEKSTLSFIKQIRLIGETLHPEVRKLIYNFFKVDIADTYSSQEVGYIAMQCPDCHQYHVMADSLIVEVLNEDNKPCKAGETGQVIITDLYNTSTPIIRYAIGDYAEVGSTCSKRPGLPSLKRILGRERNMLVLPDGQHFWPILGYAQYRNVADIKQYQVIQKDKELIQVRLVVASTLTTSQETKLIDIIQTALSYPFNIEFKYYKDKLPLSKNGKFEEFVCEL